MNKRNTFSQVAAKFGLLRILEQSAKRDCLLVLNYHRIGDADATELDSGVFSATVEEFEWQMSYLRKRYSIVSLDEVTALAAGWKTARSPRILVTFDDGYKDNYELAFPVLRSLGLPAVFFVVSSYLDHPVIPWWDRLAYGVRTCRQPVLRLSYPKVREIPLTPGRRDDEIRFLLQVLKSPETEDPDRFLDEVESACGPGISLPPASSLFLSREDISTMLRAGMSVGSHTHSHQVLSKLAPGEQLAELARSRAILSREFGVDVTALAYPVGGQSAVSATTRVLARDAGYKTAFSFYGGLNRPGHFDPFDIRRVDVDTGIPPSRFRLQTSLAIASNGFWF